MSQVTREELHSVRTFLTRPKSSSPDIICRLISLWWQTSLSSSLVQLSSPLALDLTGQLDSSLLTIILSCQQLSTMFTPRAKTPIDRSATSICIQNRPYVVLRIEFFNRENFYTFEASVECICARLYSSFQSPKPFRGTSPTRLFVMRCISSSD